MWRRRRLLRTRRAPCRLKLWRRHIAVSIQMRRRRVTIIAFASAADDIACELAWWEYIPPAERPPCPTAR